MLLNRGWAEGAKTLASSKETRSCIHLTRHSRLLSGTAVASLLALGLCAAGADPARAEAYVWNPDGASVPAGGTTPADSGTWSTSVAAWTLQSAGGTATVAWPSSTYGLTAVIGDYYDIFDPVAPDVFSVTVDGTIMFDTMTHANSAYGQFGPTILFSGGTLKFAPGGTTDHATFGGGHGMGINDAIYAFETDLADGQNEHGDAVTDLLITSGAVFLKDMSYTGKTTLDVYSVLQLGTFPGDNNYDNIPGTASVNGEIILKNNSFLYYASASGTDYAIGKISSFSATDTAAEVYISGALTGVSYRYNQDNSGFIGTTVLRRTLEASTGKVGGAFIIETDGKYNGEQGTTFTTDSLAFRSYAPGGTINAHFTSNTGGDALLSTGALDTTYGLLTVNLDAAMTDIAGVYDIIRYSGAATTVANTLFSAAPSFTGQTPGAYYFETTSASDGILHLIVLDAQDELAQYWNGAGSTGNPQGGNGTWNSATANWASDAAATGQSAWAKSVGIFANNAGTVTVDGNLSFDRLEFKVDGYEIAGAASNTLALSPYSAATGTISVDSGFNATIGVDIVNGNNFGGGPVVNTLSKKGDGNLVFIGTKSYTGLTTVEEGTLTLGDGTNVGGLTGGATVNAGAYFGGAGSVTKDVTMELGSTLTGYQGGTLNILGALDFATDTYINVALSAPSSSAMFIAQNLSTAGVGETSVDVTGAGLVAGRYALLNYFAAAAGDPSLDIVIGSGAPAGSYIENSPVGNVYVVIGGGPVVDFRYWDGAVTSGAGAIGGGSGTWSTANTNWGDANPATAHSAWSQGDIAIFEAAAGTITVDTGGGANPVEASGLHFAADNYAMIGDELTLTATNPDNLAEIAVGPYASYVATINAKLGGTAGINKTSAGTLVLAGDNAYTGGTRISVGVVSVSKDANLGDSGGALTLAGGTLLATSGFNTTRDVAIDQHGGTINVADVATPLTLSGTVANVGGQNGMLTKTGAGTLVLAANNSYSGGTAILAGAVSVGADANLGAATGGVTLNGGTLKATSGFSTGRTFSLGDSGATIDVEGAGTTVSALGAFNNSSGQSGSLTKTGAGTLIMVADNSYNGPTTVSQGTLQIGNDAGSTGSVKGDVAVAGGANFNIMRAADWTFDGVLSGSGNFGLGGAGTTTLTADSSGFGGVSTLTAGGLSVTGKLGGKLSVSGTGLLTGTGTLGDVSLLPGGSVSPGSATSIATLTTSSLDFAPGSTYIVNLDGAGNHDELTVGGTATISGGTVNLSSGSATVNDGEQITIITAATSVVTTDGDGDGTNGFNPNVVHSAYVGADIGYTPTTVFLTLHDLTNGGTTLCLPGMTANQCNTAGGINGLGPESPLPGIIRGLPSDQLGPALDQLSGSSLASLYSGMAQNSRFVREATDRHLRQTFGGVATGTPMTTASNYAEETPNDAVFSAFAEDNSGINLWGTGYGDWSRMKDDSQGEMKGSVGGLFVGADVPAFDTMRFGAVAGYGVSTFKDEFPRATATSQDFTLGVYGGGVWDAVSATFGTAYTWQNVTSKRDINIPGLQEQERAEIDAGTYQVYGDVSYTFEAGESLQVSPFLSAAYVNTGSGAFNEDGLVAGLQSGSNSFNTAFTTIGLRLAQPFMIGSSKHEISGSVGWRHAYGDVDPKIDVNFVGGMPFAVTGIPLSEDQAVVTVSWQTNLKDNLDFGLDYTGLFGDGYNSQNITGRMNIRF